MKKSGFSLVELMIVSLGIAGIGLVGMQINKNMLVAEERTIFKSEVHLITNEITNILADSSKCINTFGPAGNISGISSSVSNINGKYYTSSSGLAPASGYGNGNITINDYTVTSTDARLLNNEATLTITFGKKKILPGEHTKTMDIKLYVTVDNSKNITSCHSTSNGTSELWKNGTGNNIYYDGGNVGIGTATPSTTLDIAGSLRVGSQIQVTTCDQTNEGAQRFNKDTHQLEVCSATTATYATLPSLSHTFNYEWKSLRTLPTSTEVEYAYYSSTSSLSKLNGSNVPSSASFYDFDDSFGWCPDITGENYSYYGETIIFDGPGILLATLNARAHPNTSTTGQSIVTNIFVTVSGTTPSGNPSDSDLCAGNRFYNNGVRMFSNATCIKVIKGPIFPQFVKVSLCPGRNNTSQDPAFDNHAAFHYLGTITKIQ